jgi:hypothetical protein
VFEFNKDRFSVDTEGSIQGERAIGDLKIVADLDADGCIVTVRFESYSLDEAEGLPKFANLASLVGEGCNESGTFCAVANGGLLEVGLNLSEAGGRVADFDARGLRGRHVRDGVRAAIRHVSEQSELLHGQRRHDDRKEGRDPEQRHL